MTLTTSQAFGYLAATGSFVLMYGLFCQIRLNHRRKSTDGISPTVIFAVLYTYGMWMMHGWTVPDRFLMATQTPGTLLALILVSQWWWYRVRNPRRS